MTHPIAPAWGAHSSDCAPKTGSGSGSSVLQIVAETEQRGNLGKPVRARRGLVKAGRHNDQQDAVRSNSASAGLAELRAAPARVGRFLPETTAAGAGHSVSASVAGFLADCSSHLTTFRVAAAKGVQFASISSDISNPK